jgi:hypothetical protein
MKAAVTQLCACTLYVCIYVCVQEGNAMHAPKSTRQRVAEEMFTSEETYVRHLHTLLQVCVCVCVLCSESCGMCVHSVRCACACAWVHAVWTCLSACGVLGHTCAVCDTPICMRVHVCVAPQLFVKPLLHDGESRSPTIGRLCRVGGLSSFLHSVERLHTVNSELLTALCDKVGVCVCVCVCVYVVTLA